VGLEAPDDAAVIEVPPGKVMVQTVDQFRPFMDDPYLFAKVAANHALGDIYAMGAEPHSALVIATLPHALERQTEGQLAQLMTGATEVLTAAHTALIGGHTSEGCELSLGFSVNGLLERQRILRKAGMRAGDWLILTKPLGTGILFAADMRHRAKGRWIEAALELMLQSSRAAAECLRRHGATACTDVTGFGLLGHLLEMTRASGMHAEIDLHALPLMEGAVELAADGIVSSLQPQNLRLQSVIAERDQVAGDPCYPLLFDPQTSGGLLASVPGGSAESCVRELVGQGCVHAGIVGRVVPGGGGADRIRIV
jgi:selenide,water dikinase